MPVCTTAGVLGCAHLSQTDVVKLGAHNRLAEWAVNPLQEKTRQYRGTMEHAETVQRISTYAMQPCALSHDSLHICKLDCSSPLHQVRSFHDLDWGADLMFKVVQPAPPKITATAAQPVCSQFSILHPFPSISMFCMFTLVPRCLIMLPVHKRATNVQASHSCAYTYTANHRDTLQPLCWDASLVPSCDLLTTPYNSALIHRLTCIQPNHRRISQRKVKACRVMWCHCWSQPCTSPSITYEQLVYRLRCALL